MGQVRIYDQTWKMQAAGGITLTGSGFGTKPAGGTLLYNTFEDEVVGASEVDVGFDSHTETGAGTISASEVTDTKAHSGSRCFYQEWSGGSVYEALLKEIPQSQDLYVGHWFRWEVESTPSEGLFKLMRRGCNSVYSGAPKVAGTGFPWGDGSGEINGPGDFNIHTGVDDVGSDMDGLAAGLPDVNEWMWFESRYRLSTPGVKDGWAKWYGNGNESHTPEDATAEDRLGDPYSACMTVDGSTSGASIDWLLLFNGVDKGSDTTTWYLYADDVLIQTTFARVIVTDAQTYANSTNWAPQDVTSWSDTEIQIDNPHWADFPSGSTVYFHVFDADDSHVSSFERTVP